MMGFQFYVATMGSECDLIRIFNSPLRVGRSRFYWPLTVRVYAVIAVDSGEGFLQLSSSDAQQFTHLIQVSLYALS
jgi:hypothetical protein